MNKKLYELHKAFGKHEAVKIGTIKHGRYNQEPAAYDQFACSCGGIFYDSNHLGEQCGIATDPLASWAKRVVSFYKKNDLLDDFIKYVAKQHDHETAGAYVFRGFRKGSRPKKYSKYIAAYMASKGLVYDMEGMENKDNI